MQRRMKVAQFKHLLQKPKILALCSPRTNTIMIELPGYSQLWGATDFKKAFFLYHPKERCPGKREDTKSS